MHKEDIELVESAFYTAELRYWRRYLVTLALFVALFLAGAWCAFRAVKREAQRNEDNAFIRGVVRNAMKKKDEETKSNGRTD